MGKSNLARNICLLFVKLSIFEVIMIWNSKEYMVEVYVEKSNRHISMTLQYGSRWNDSQPTEKWIQGEWKSNEPYVFSVHMKKRI